MGILAKAKRRPADAASLLPRLGINIPPRVGLDIVSLSEEGQPSLLYSYPQVLFSSCRSPAPLGALVCVLSTRRSSKSS